MLHLIYVCQYGARADLWHSHSVNKEHNLRVADWALMFMRVTFCKKKKNLKITLYFVTKNLFNYFTYKIVFIIL